MLYRYLVTCIKLCIGNEEEELPLLSLYAYEATAADVDDKLEFVEGHQVAPGEDSFITESQTSPKCSPMLRNKVNCYCQLDVYHSHLQL